MQARTGTCALKTQEIADWAGIDQRSVFRILKNLEGYGCLRRARSGRKVEYALDLETIRAHGSKGDTPSPIAAPNTDAGSSITAANPDRESPFEGGPEKSPKDDTVSVMGSKGDTRSPIAGSPPQTPTLTPQSSIQERLLDPEIREEVGREESEKRGERARWLEIMEQDSRWPAEKNLNGTVAHIEEAFRGVDLVVEATKAHNWLKTTAKGRAKKNLPVFFLNWLAKAKKDLQWNKRPAGVRPAGSRDLSSDSRLEEMRRMAREHNS